MTKPADAPRFDGSLLRKLGENLPALIELFRRFQGNLGSESPGGAAALTHQYTPEQLKEAAEKTLRECD